MVITRIDWMEWAVGRGGWLYGKSWPQSSLLDQLLSYQAANLESWQIKRGWGGWVRPPRSSCSASSNGVPKATRRLLAGRERVGSEMPPLLTFVCFKQ